MEEGKFWGEVGERLEDELGATLTEIGSIDFTRPNTNSGGVEGASGGDGKGAPISRDPSFRRWQRQGGLRWRQLGGSDRPRPKLQAVDGAGGGRVRGLGDTGSRRLGTGELQCPMLIEELMQMEEIFMEEANGLPNGGPKTYLQSQD
ncbi:hypothetical protein E2562_020925 [Oryza meyeriana var. granulata]|uniref:Uncharacterized protein n=1 Tax=Oryza meyeriana var. granulata TaxID=110450 RepID=A0A6G1DY87_9ORYZ|nr:hypothetical protein E2562_020925 [Oryza meyeriana var. granulata]